MWQFYVLLESSVLFWCVYFCGEFWFSGIRLFRRWRYSRQCRMALWSTKILRWFEQSSKVTSLWLTRLTRRQRMSPASSRPWLSRVKCIWQTADALSAVRLDYLLSVTQLEFSLKLNSRIMLSFFCQAIYYALLLVMYQTFIYCIVSQKRFSQ